MSTTDTTCGNCEGIDPASCLVCGPRSDTERDERLRRRREHDELLRRRVERNLADIMDSEAGKRCVSCAHLKHNDLGYCQVGQCSCTVGTSLAGTASVVLRDASVLLDRQAAEVARLDAVVTALVKVGTGALPHLYLGLCPDATEGPDVRDEDCPACRALDGGAA